MLEIILISLFAALAVTVAASPGFDPKTGTITDERWRSGVPLGGIGCGKIELFTDGSFGGFTINHNWDRATGWMKGIFAAVFADDGSRKSATMLRLASPEEYEGVDNVAGTTYVGMFPKAQVAYSDPELPVEISLHAFSPLIPHNAADSALPAACIEFTVKNPGKSGVTTSVAISWENTLGTGGDRKEEWTNTDGNHQEAAATPGGLQGVLFSTNNSYDDRRQNTVGQYLVVAETGDGIEITTCPASLSNSIWMSFRKSFSDDSVPPSFQTLFAQRSNSTSWVTPRSRVMASYLVCPGDLRTVLGSPPLRCSTGSTVFFRLVTLLTPAMYLSPHFTRNLKFL